MSNMGVIYFFIIGLSKVMELDMVVSMLRRLKDDGFEIRVIYVDNDFIIVV